MKPTPKIRFVKRNGKLMGRLDSGEEIYEERRILQQWFEQDDAYGGGEWRDVPVEVE